MLPSHTVKSQPSQLTLRAAARPVHRAVSTIPSGRPRLRQGQDSERVFPSSTQSNRPRRDATNKTTLPGSGHISAVAVTLAIGATADDHALY
jgi:hypothetical protein